MVLPSHGRGHWFKSSTAHPRTSGGRGDLGPPLGETFQMTSLRKGAPAGMAASALVAIVVLGLVSPIRPRAAGVWHPHMRAAITYANSRTGDISFAVVDERGNRYGYRRWHNVPSASVVKAMFLAA